MNVAPPSPTQPRQSLGRAIIAVARVLASLAVVGAVGGCTEAGKSDGTSRQEHEDGDGPLAASSTTGGKALNAPVRTPWTASFGGLLLCAKEQGDHIVISGVRYDTRPDPEVASTSVRTVPPVAEQHAGKQVEWAPFYGLLGEPGDFRVAMRGNYSSVAGHVITAGCDANTTTEGFTELVTTLRVPATGAWVRRTFVDYEANGRPYTLVIRWEMVGCGTQTGRIC